MPRGRTRRGRPFLLGHQVEILVDGLRQGYGLSISKLPVTAGTHQVTLRNSAEGINKTFTVEIKANELTEMDPVNPRN